MTRRRFFRPHRRHAHPRTRPRPIRGRPSGPAFTHPNVETRLDWIWGLAPGPVYGRTDLPALWRRVGASWAVVLPSPGHVADATTGLPQPGAHYVTEAHGLPSGHVRVRTSHGKEYVVSYEG